MAWFNRLVMDRYRPEFPDAGCPSPLIIPTIHGWLSCITCYHRKHLTSSGRIVQLRLTNWAPNNYFMVDSHFESLWSLSRRIIATGYFQYEPYLCAAGSPSSLKPQWTFAIGSCRSRGGWEHGGRFMKQPIRGALAQETRERLRDRL